MARDPIMELVRRAGDALAKQAGDNLHRFFEDFRTAQRDYAERLVRPSFHAMDAKSAHLPEEPRIDQPG